MKRLLVAAVAASTCVLGAQAYAHHSFAATYIEDKSVTI
jgi:methionine-rich copper-binding protein CopC